MNSFIKPSPHTQENAPMPLTLCPPPLSRVWPSPGSPSSSGIPSAARLCPGNPHTWPGCSALLDPPESHLQQRHHGAHKRTEAKIQIPPTPSGTLTFDHVKEILHGVLVTAESLLVVFGFILLRSLAGQIYSFLRTNMKTKFEKKQGLLKDTPTSFLTTEIL